MSYEIEKTDEEWQVLLTPEEYNLLRKKGTEPPFSGRLLHNKKKGVYSCAGCGNELFKSDAKFDSGTGWPSFFRPISENRIEVRVDINHEMRRTEVMCGRCGGHLGHVFGDGPEPTGLRYCMNSVALHFKEK